MAALPLTLHGVLLEVHGLGVLLTGSSGVGKSELALELVTRGHRLVADDAAQVSRRGRQLYGSCPPLISGFLEARSLGILNVKRLFGARALRTRVKLDLVIELDLPANTSDSGLERLSGRRGSRQILGIAVAEISIPIRLGHNLAVLVEAAARDHKLRARGYHADADLSGRQLKAMRAVPPLPPGEGRGEDARGSARREVRRSSRPSPGALRAHPSPDGRGGKR